MFNIETCKIDKEFHDDIASLRATGDILADELSVLRHTARVTGRGMEALQDWDALSFKIRGVLRELEAKGWA